MANVFGLQRSGSDGVFGLQVVRSTVSSDLALEWSVAALVGTDLALEWKVAAPVGNDLPLAWSVAASVGKDLPLQWKVASPVGNDLPLEWKVAAQVGSDLPLAYIVERGVAGEWRRALVMVGKEFWEVERDQLGWGLEPATSIYGVPLVWDAVLGCRRELALGELLEI